MDTQRRGPGRTAGRGARCDRAPARARRAARDRRPAARLPAGAARADGRRRGHHVVGGARRRRRGHARRSCARTCRSSARTVGAASATTSLHLSEQIAVVLGPDDAAARRHRRHRQPGARAGQLLGVRRARVRGGRAWWTPTPPWSGRRWPGSWCSRRRPLARGRQRPTDATHRHHRDARGRRAGRVRRARRRRASSASSRSPRGRCGCREHVDLRAVDVASELQILAFHDRRRTGHGCLSMRTAGPLRDPAGRGGASWCQPLMIETSSAMTTLSETRTPPASRAAFQVRPKSLREIVDAGLEARTRVAERVDRGAVELGVELDGLRDAVDRQVADDDVVLAGLADLGGDERPLAELLDVEEVAALEVAVAVGVAGGDGGRVERDGDRGARQVVADDDGALGDRDGAADLGDAGVADRERGLGVRGVDGPGARREAGGKSGRWWWCSWEVLRGC